MTKRVSPAASGTAHRLRFRNLDREAVAHAGETIYQSARRGGVRIVGACGGRGTCGSCMVRVIEGKVHQHSQAQAGGGTHAARKWVRACLISARTDLTLDVAPRSLAPVVRTDVEADAGEALELDPGVVSIPLALSPATLADNAADSDRVLRALEGRAASLDLAAARELPRLLRKYGWSLDARVRGTELIGFAPRGSPPLGLAVDLGTTNAAAFLVDLASGARLASLGIENPQAAWGGDVITRLNHAIRAPGGGEELRQAALAAVNGLAHDLCREVGAVVEDIADVVVCGNTPMHHLLLGLPVAQLGRAPFVAAVRGALDVKAHELGVAVHPGAYVHLAPNVGGFVGGDHVAALLATEERWSAATTSLVMDIGTNTEISLVHRGGMLSASCPSGPALEGGHISCGMRAAEGAIEGVKFENGRIALRTIGDEAPVGLCGSGVLDAVAALLEGGIIDPRGRLAAGRPEVERAHGRLAAVLAPGVHFTQEDVRAVQLAKAAIRTGVEMLLREARLHEADIERFVIAGAFGAYLDLGSAIAIGLLPELPIERFAQVGNAAGAGVRRMLVSRRARERARELAARCRYVELNSRADFQKAFLHHIGFMADPRRTS